MGKTKIKTIDEAQPVEEAKKPVKKLGRQDELVERLKAELEIDQKDSEQLRKPENQKSGESDKSEKTGIPSPSESSEKKQPQKPGKSKPRSKKYQEITKDLDKSKSYSLNEALELLKKSSYTKFIGTLEAHINTAVSGIRGLVSLPYASGKKLRILAFANSTSKESKPTFEVTDHTPGVGSDSPGVNSVTFGDDSTIEKINKGPSASSGLNFDLVVTTPSWMPKLAKIARILGPRGLMPNPKNGTITNDLKKSVESFQAGKTEYRTEPKAPVIHLALGKLDQPTEQLSANIKILLQTLGKTRVKKVFLSPTMGPSVKVDLSSI